MAEEPRVEFLKTLASALAPLGQTAGELTEHLADCSAGLGLAAQFFVLPTMVQFSYIEEQDRERITFIPIRGGRIDLETQGLLQSIAVDVGKGRISPEAGIRAIEALMVHPPRFSLVLRLAAGALGPGAIALLLGSGAREAAVAMTIGLAVALFYGLAARSSRLQGLLELASAAIAAFLALLLAHVLHRFDAPTVVLAAIVQLLPGLRITQGVAELAAGDVISGTARLAGAVMTLVNLSVGVAVVWTAFSRLHELPVLGGAHGATSAMLVLAVIGAALAFSVSENARRRDLGWVFAAVVVATVASRVGVWALGATFGVGVASLAVGLAGNAYSRYLHHAKATITVPGLTVLVPGALGFRGVFSLVSNGGASGINVVVTTLLIAMALVVGSTIAEAIVAPLSVGEQVAEPLALPPRLPRFGRRG
ncbi:MAG: threonine/serine exporter ThrE family protein [Thermoleophilia bacterium]